MKQIVTLLRSTVTSMVHRIRSWSEWDSEQWQNGVHRRDGWG